jgi:putative membrane protein
MFHRLSVILLTGTLLLSPVASAQEAGMASSDDHTAREETEGKEIWQQMERKEVACKDLTDDQFAALGEYFMGEMTGDAHEAMNAMMTRMMGEDGEEEMHVIMGKRMSGCGGDGTLPMGNAGMMTPMMGMMMGRGMMGGGWNDASPMMGWSNGHAPDTLSSMMGYGFGFAPFGFLFMLLWWALIIAGIVALVKWISRASGVQGGKSSLDILKERYAKGEIDKKEFEERKKDLS